MVLYDIYQQILNDSCGGVVADCTTRKIGCELSRFKKEREHVDF